MENKHDKNSTQVRKESNLYFSKVLHCFKGGEKGNKDISGEGNFFHIEQKKHIGKWKM